MIAGQAFGRKWLGFSLALLASTVAVVSLCRADETYIVRGGVFEDMLACPMVYPTVCEGGPVGPLAGVTVAARNGAGKLVKAVRTNSKGTFKFRLRPGEYTLRINVKGYSQPIRVIDRNISGITFTVGKSR